ncbi:MAG: hypothetical protein COB36_11745 [Alphaproteobacteria bacterium]|nr:MAG: hypothetical protein COB36_11745 [Alphaproteobacteria bacterium]
MLFSKMFQAVLLVLASPSAWADDKACTAANGVKYNPWEIFDSNYACYQASSNFSSSSCPAVGTVCSNHALMKLADYESEDYQDLLFTPHRGLWGSTYGSLDPTYDSASEVPGQNTIAAFNLVKSFTDNYPKNKEGKNYGAFLRGKIIEIDATSFGDDVSTAAGIISHYLTTDNTDTGSINQYLVDMTSDDINSAGDLEKRDFSSSTTKLSEMLTANVTSEAFVDSGDPNNGLIALIDTKSRRGDLQCQVFDIESTNSSYGTYNCKYNEDPDKTTVKNDTDLLVANEIYDAGGDKNLVIKTSASYQEITNTFSADEITKFMWQPHPAETIEKYVQYIHDWLVNVPRSVAAWEMNIYYEGDQTNQMFCVTGYNSAASDDFPYGQITVQNVSSMNDDTGCLNGPYINMLDYLRVNTGNPDYFGFTKEQKAEVLISGNRANLWIISTSASIGTSDRYYRWQALGGDPEYNMSDPVRYLSYPYVAYQIFTSDRMEAVRQAIESGLFVKYGGPD